MTDQNLLDLLNDLERLLAMPVAHPDPGAIGQWDEAFKASLKAAERGPRWPEVQARGKALGVLLERKVAQFQAAQQTIKRNLEQGGLGQRALSAYGAGRPVR